MWRRIRLINVLSYVEYNFFEDRPINNYITFLFQEAVIVLLDRSHQDEQQYLLLLLTTAGNPDVVLEIQSWSQQQRKDQLCKLHSQRQEFLSGKL